MKSAAIARWVLLSLICLWSAALSAAVVERDDPQVMIRQTTDQLLQLARAARDYPPQDKARYYREVAAILDQVIDRDYFARGVMATYASARQYQALADDATRRAFDERIRRFADTMETVLIERYADVLLSFKGERIDVALVDGEDISSGKARILQTIFDQSGATYRVQYSAQRGADGAWLVRNVVVEGVNMGATYRTQFAEAVERNRGDVDYVVNHWQELMGPAANSGAQP